MNEILDLVKFFASLLLAFAGIGTILVWLQRENERKDHKDED